jgi:uncharacterized cupredoxin-like copper-binding protein
MRTFAMSVAASGVALVALVLGYFLVAVVLPEVARDPSAAGGFAAPLIAFFVVFAVLGLASWLWPGARRRSWFWVVDTAAGALILLAFAPQIGYDLTHPGTPQGFIVALFAVVGAGAAIIGGVAAFLDVRRGGAGWSRGGRAGWAATAIAALAIGAAATSALAGGGGGASGGGVAAAPTVTGTLAIENIKFMDTQLSMQNGEVLGLFVTNRDGAPHSFDIDALNLHVTVPANSTSAVAIKPTAAGTLEFYCAVPGHRDAGMVGTVVVQ